MVQLSVVLITRNQEWNIPRLVESVQAATAHLPGTEIVLVDSASTDATVTLAAQYPISVIQLDADQRLTAGLGRYVGYKESHGDLILFLDGDMELAQGWLELALQVFAARADVAVITGHVIDRPVTTAYTGAFMPAPDASDPVEVKRLPYTGGAALFRRSVLEEVSTFHPYVYSDEEPELCIRIRHAGHAIVQLDFPIAYHYSRPTFAISTLFARWRRNLYLGAGQNLRYNVGRPTLGPYLAERGYGLIPVAGLIASIVTVVWSLRSGRRFGLLLPVAALSGIVAIDSVRKRSVYRALYSLILRLLIADGTVRGFFLKPIEVRDVPVRYKTLGSAPLPSVIEE